MIKNVLRVSLLMMLLGIQIMANNLLDSTATKFIKYLILGKDEIKSIILPEELEMSNRLGINYIGVKNKSLISKDLDSLTLAEIKNGSVKYEYNVESLTDDYSKVVFSVPSKKIIREYFFKDDYMISTPRYYSRNWELLESEYFVFHISDPAIFNNYCIYKLDNFINEAADILQFNRDEIINLKKNKIHYFLCKDDDEIKLLTGYAARGLYYIPYDYIITTFNCHYHELLHLLINYKLKKLPLFTLPVFQEGFAVAFGGRGGKEPGVILETGLFLVNSGFLDYTSLLDKSGFMQNDQSMSYPVSGLYNKFLVNEIGIKKYLSLYVKYSGSESYVDNIKVDSNDLPGVNGWNKYFQDYNDKSLIKIDYKSSDFDSTVIVKGNSFAVIENPEYLLFRLKDTLFISTKNQFRNYKSKMFKELFPNKIYNSEKYVIIADSNEVSVYNLFSNNLLAKYVKGLSIKNIPVARKDGFYIFKVRKEVFDEQLNGELSFSE